MPSRAAALIIVLLSPALLAQTATKQPSKTRVSAEDPMRGFDQFVAGVLEDWKVRGVGVGVISDGKVVFVNGYGVRDEARKLPVTARTVMPIGSITKSFTVAGVAALVDQGRLAWDTPAREFFPDLRLYDETATDRVTLRDMVTHRTGLPRHDIMWYGNESWTRKDIVSRLRYLEPSKDLRERFQYNNLMFMTAGYLTGEAMGGTWEQAIRRLIFEPLKMTRSSFTVAEMEKSDDFSLGYQEGKEAAERIVKVVPFRPIDEAGPAGSINASAEDLTNYVLMLVNGGAFDGRQVLSAANVREMTTPQMVTPAPVRFSEVGHTQYGMGWFVTTYRGHKMVNHGGNIDGFSALAAFIPERKIGAVVLANMDGTGVPSVIAYQIFDRLLRMEPVDWSGRLLKFREQGRAAQETAEQAGFTRRRDDTKPSHPLDEYAGEFEHPGYGDLTFARDGDGFKVTYGRLTSPVRHYHFDTYEVPANEFDPFERLKFTFMTDVAGDITAVSVPFQPDVKPIVFTRKPERLTRQQLESLTGTYELGPNTVAVSLQRDDTLVMTIPGAPQYELVPVRGTLFNVKQIEGFSVEFKGDQIVFYQPGGTYAGKRKPAS
jgi:CubicO group peptidase (beta-lactamase class C family)